MQYNKPAKSLQEQIALLQSRGLHIPDIDKAHHYLANISYYRLSAYMLPFQKISPKHQFKPNISFNDILNLYVFDRELRLLIFDATERIEVAFRCQLIYQYAMANGANWYEDPNHFYNSYHFGKFITQFKREMQQSKEVFIQHYQQKYTSPANPPAWMSLEILSFGQISKLFSNLKTSHEKKAIGKHFSIHHKVLSSWMENLTYIRNICAHHARLWNKILVIKPEKPRKISAAWVNNTSFNNDRIYISLVIIQYLLNQINPDTSFKERLKNLLMRNPNIPQKALGFPSDWRTERFWQ